jgi:nicotinamide mononucleotide transporter
MLQTAFTLLGAPVTWLEAVAFALALGCVVCNVLEIHWAWPLAFAASVLYAWLFWDSRLYGNFTVQLFFAGSACWGWYKWLFGRRAGRAEAAPLVIEGLSRRGWSRALVAWLVGWPLLGLFLARYTDSPVPYLDAFPTAGSFVAQILLALKYVANWPLWLIVNASSVWLYLSQSLWLTAILYLIFALLSLAGWRRWQRLAR